MKNLLDLSVLHSIRKERVQRRIDYLRDKALNATEQGVSQEKYCDSEIVVSLTSFGKRIYDVCLAIESIMQGSLRPNRIVLWLSEEEFKGLSLPVLLQKQQQRGLQVCYCEDLRSYQKLIPSLKYYPQSCIITIDDDVMYECDIVERLVRAHIEHQNAVCACRIHRVRLNKDGKPKNYNDWEWGTANCQLGSPLLFPTGVGGVLYPPRCFSSEVFNSEVFMSICPYADDVWFYAMELLNGTPIVQTYTGQPGGYYLDLPSGRIDALSTVNTSTTSCNNDVQLRRVFERYNLYEKLR